MKELIILLFATITPAIIYLISGNMEIGIIAFSITNVIGWLLWQNKSYKNN